jgi:hypothetical protein
LWRCEKTCESTWRRWDLLLERGPFLFLFRHRVPNNAHVIELGIRSCTLQNMQRCHCIPSFPWSSFRAHAQTRWPRFKWVLGGYPLVGPSCWAGTHSGGNHFTCEIGTRVGTMI